MPSAQHSKYGVVSQKGAPYNYKERKILGAVIWLVVAFDVPRLLFVMYTGITTFGTWSCRNSEPQREVLPVFLSFVVEFAGRGLHLSKGLHFLCTPGISTYIFGGVRITRTCHPPRNVLDNVSNKPEKKNTQFAPAIQMDRDMRRHLSVSVRPGVRS